MARHCRQKEILAERKRKSVGSERGKRGFRKL